MSGSIPGLAFKRSFFLWLNHLNIISYPCEMRLNLTLCYGV